VVGSNIQHLRCDITIYITNVGRFLRLCFSGAEKTLQLGLFRSDYLLHEDTVSHEVSLKQVEFNTISSSFGALSYHAAAMHRLDLFTF
jgi:hypothetical protein